MRNYKNNIIYIVYLFQKLKTILCFYKFAQLQMPKNLNVNVINDYGGCRVK